MSKQTAFGYCEEEAAELWGRVLDGTEVLITHGPPGGYLDAGMGCAELTRCLWRCRPLVHVFGHAHKGYGTAAVRYDDVQRRYEEALSKNKASGGSYVPLQLRKKEEEVEMPEEMLSLPKGRPIKGETTILANCAIKGGADRKPIVVVV